MYKNIVMNLGLFDEGGTGSVGGTEGAGTGGAKSGSQAAYSFEQAEEIANSRAEKASRAALADFYRKQGLSEAEITTAIQDFKEKQKANAPDVAALEKERDEAKKELEQMKHLNILRDKGVKSDDLDYVMFKIEKLVDEKTDFAKAAEKFLKENPRYANATAYRVSASTGTESQGSGGGKNDAINDAIRRAVRR